jgi:hypothetical protein
MRRLLVGMGRGFEVGVKYWDGLGRVGLIAFLRV